MIVITSAEIMETKESYLDLVSFNLYSPVSYILNGENPEKTSVKQFTDRIQKIEHNRYIKGRLQTIGYGISAQARKILGLEMNRFSAMDSNLRSCMAINREQKANLKGVLTASLLTRLKWVFTGVEMSS